MPSSPFLNQLRATIRVRNYAHSTELSYVDWARRYIRFHGNRHPDELSEEHVVQFLSDLALRRKVAPSTQNQALNALAFMYRHHLNRPLGDITMRLLNFRQ